MKIGVVIPVVKTDFIGGLLECIGRNTVLPDSIIIVDNSIQRDIIQLDKNLVPFEIYKPSSPLGVNQSWNHGIHELGSRVDMISVLNDDLLLETMFFEKLTKLAQFHNEAAVLCPETVPLARDITHVVPIEKTGCISMHKREGWAWSIRSEVARKIPPIPEELKIWFGDDWFWLHTVRRAKMPWLKMVGNKCFHYVSQTTRDCGITIRAERRMFEHYI